MKIKELFEMAAPSENIFSRTYYHGTSSTPAAESILKNGIKPPDLSLRKGNLRPVEGKVYITDDLAYAQIYAIGGDIAGTDSGDLRYLNKKGYLFIIPGRELKDIQPDEDSIGGFLSDVLSMKEGGDSATDFREGLAHKMAFKDASLVNNIYYLAKHHLSPGTLRKVKDGEYHMWAKAGKVLVKRLSDVDKIKMVEYGFHVAHTGPLIPTQCWQIDLEEIPNLEKDGSNFFKLAKRIK